MFVIIKNGLHSNLFKKKKKSLLRANLLKLKLFLHWLLFLFNVSKCVILTLVSEDSGVSFKN